MSLRLLLPNQLNFRFKRPESSSRTKKEMQPTLHLFLAAGEGFEPSHTESESAVLPLHKPAISCALTSAGYIILTYPSFVKSYFSFFQTFSERFFFPSPFSPIQSFFALFFSFLLTLRYIFSLFHRGLSIFLYNSIIA